MTNSTAVKPFVGIASIRFGNKKVKKSLIPPLTQEYSKKVDTSGIKCVTPFVTMVDIVGAFFDQVIEFNKTCGHILTGLPQFAGTDISPSEIRLWVNVQEVPVVENGKLHVKLGICCSPSFVPAKIQETTNNNHQDSLFTGRPPILFSIDVELRPFQRLSLKTNETMIAKISSTSSSSTTVLNSPLNLIHKKIKSEQDMADSQLQLQKEQEVEQTFEMVPNIQFSPPFDHEISFSDVKEEQSLSGFLNYILKTFKAELTDLIDNEQVDLTRSIVVSELMQMKEHYLKMVCQNPSMSLSVVQRVNPLVLKSENEVSSSSEGNSGSVARVYSGHQQNHHHQQQQQVTSFLFLWHKFFKAVCQSVLLLNPLRYLAVRNTTYQKNYDLDVCRISGSSLGWEDMVRIRQIEELAFLNLEHTVICEISTGPNSQSPNSGFHTVPPVYQRLDQKTLAKQIQLSKGRRVRIHAWFPFYSLERPIHKYSTDQEGFKIDVDDVQMKKDENCFLDERMCLVIQDEKRVLKCGVHKPLNLMFWFELRNINNQVCLWKCDICLSKEEFDFDPHFWTTVRNKLQQNFVELKKDPNVSHLICVNSAAFLNL